MILVGVESFMYILKGSIRDREPLAGRIIEEISILLASRLRRSWTISVLCVQLLEEKEEEQEGSA